MDGIETTREEASGRGGGWRAEASIAVAGSLAWAWLVTPLVPTPSLALLAAAAPLIAVVLLAVERRRPGLAAPLLAAALFARFAILAAGTGGSLSTLVRFALGILAPRDWQGEHLLLRALPLAMLVAFVLRPSAGTALVSGLGVTAFVAIALAMWRSIA